MTSNTSSGPSMRERLDTNYQWTPRQRQVLDLITRGRTNTQIADELGISLAGAKWHVGEVLSKLEAGSREEAADYWRRYHGLAPRFARIFRGTLAASSLRVGAAVAAIAVVAAAVIVVLAARGDGSGPAAGDPSPTATVTSTAGAPPTTAASPGPAIALALDAVPRPQAAAGTRQLGPPPPSQFPVWDGRSTVIYDMVSGQTIDLGPGVQPAAFSPDSTKAVWSTGTTFPDGQEVMVIDLKSGTRKSLGPGRYAVFLDNENVVLYEPDRSNVRKVVNVATGARSDLTGNPDMWFGAIPPTAPPGFELKQTPAAGSQDRYEFELVGVSSGRTALTFTGFAAVPAGPREMAIATVPSGGLSNIYLVNVDTGATEYAATARVEQGNWPFAASKDFVAWTEGFCAQPRGRVHLFDRKTKTVSEVDDGAITDEESYLRRYITMTPSGLLAAGSSGAKYLIDPATLTWVGVVPLMAAGHHSDVSWSPDYRYASHGPVGGHGGLCGP